MNVTLLRKVQKLILEEPKRFHMGTFGIRRNPKREDAPPCGTVACIAGWAVIVKEKIPLKYSFDLPFIDRYSGMGALDITEEQAHRLFYEENWPKKFTAYKADGSKKSAKIAAARIEHFIKTKGRS